MNDTNFEVKSFLSSFIDTYDSKDWNSLVPFYAEYIKTNDISGEIKSPVIVHRNNFISTRALMSQPYTTKHRLRHVEARMGSVCGQLKCEFELEQYEDQKRRLVAIGECEFHLIKTNDWQIDKVEKSVKSVKLEGSLLSKFFRRSPVALFCFPD